MNQNRACHNPVAFSNLSVASNGEFGSRSPVDALPLLQNIRGLHDAKPRKVRPPQTTGGMEVSSFPTTRPGSQDKFHLQHLSCGKGKTAAWGRWLLNPWSILRTTAFKACHLFNASLASAPIEMLHNQNPVVYRLASLRRGA